MNYVGRNRAWGGFSPQGARPSAGSLSIMVGDTPRTWLAQYGAGGFLQETHTPVWKPDAAAGDPRRRQAGLARSAVGGAQRRPRRRRRLRPAGADQRRQAPHRHHVPQDRHGARRDDGHSRARKATCWCARCTPSACPASSTTRPRRPRPSASGRSRSGSPASTRRQIRYPGKLEAQTVSRHDPRPAPVLPRTAAHPAGKPGDEEVAVDASDAKEAQHCSHGHEIFASLRMTTPRACGCAGAGWRGSRPPRPGCWCRGRRSRRRRPSSGSRSPAPG